MSLSLRDQLLATGLMSKKQAQASDQQKRQQKKTQPDLGEQRQREIAKAAAEKAARDAALNKQQQEKAERKARLAQVKQLVEQNRLPKITEGEDYYNFLDGVKIRRLGVDPALRARLMSGEVAIVRCEGRYEIVPAAIAERIAERIAQAVIPANRSEEKPLDPDDPYKDFVVPDDLRW
ncbi:MAG: DUF2058 family protein [Nevskia sp.]